MSEWQRGEYTIDTDRKRLDVELIHDYLSNSSYWAKGRSMQHVACSIENSLNFGVFRGSEQVGFARVVTDYATFAWLADVFIVEQHRGQGLGRWLLEVTLTHPKLQGIRRWLLATRDAHGLYLRYGFSTLKDPALWLERSLETAFKAN